MPRHVLLAAAILVVVLTTLVFAGVEASVWGRSAAGLAALVMLGAIAVLTGRTLIPRDATLFAAALVPLSALLTALWSVGVHATLERAVVLGAAASAFVLLRTMPASPRAARVTLDVLAVVALAVTLYGLAMTLSGRAEVLWVAKNAYQDSVTGTFINRSHFALFLAAWLFVGLGRLAGAGPRLRLALLPAILVGLVALPLTLSRGGLLAAAVAAPVFLVLLPPARRRALVPVIAVAAVAVAVVAATNWSRLVARVASALEPSAEFSASARLAMWRGGLEAALDRPLLGWGAGTFESFFARYRDPMITRNVPNAHQDYIELFAEQGALGLLLVGCAVVVVAKHLVRAYRAADAFRPLIAGAIAGLAAIAVGAAVDFPLAIPALLLTIAAIAGLALRLGDAPEEGEAAVLAPRASRAVAVVVVLFTAAIAASGLRSWWGDQYLRAGDALFARPDWDAAAEQYEAATMIDRLDPQAWESLAHTELNRGKFRRAEREGLMAAALAHFTEAERLDPSNGDYNLQLAWLHNFAGRREQAAAEFENALADDPNNANTLQLMGLFYLHRKELGRGARGEELVARAMAIYPKAFGGKIHELHYLIPDVDRLLAMIPEGEPFLIYQLAVYLRDRTPQLDEATGLFELAMERSEWRVDWLLEWAGMLASAGDLGGSIELLDRLPEEARTAGLAIQQGRLLRAAERVDEAVALLAAGSERWPDAADLVRELAIYHAGADATEAALRRYLEAAGEDAGYLTARGWRQLGRGDGEAARASFERALELEPDYPWARDGLNRL